MGAPTTPGRTGLDTTADRVLLVLAGAVTTLVVALATYLVVRDDGTTTVAETPATTTSAAPTTTVAPTTTTTTTTTTTIPPTVPTTRYVPPTVARIATTVPYEDEYYVEDDWDPTLRVQEYFDASADFDAAAFLAQWRYPVRVYYANTNASRGLVEEKMWAHWNQYTSLDSWPVGTPSVTTRGDEMIIVHDYSYDWVRTNGERRRGTETIRLVVARSDLRIIEVRDV